MNKILVGGYVSLLAFLVLPLYVTVPVAAQMMGISTIVIVIASINAAKRERKRQRLGDAAEQRDVIGREQAYRFPVVASCALFGMFLAFKYLPKDWVSFLLTLYGVIFGGLAFAGVIGSLLEQMPFLPPFVRKTFGWNKSLSMSVSDLLGLFCSAPVTYWYYVTKDGLPNNILACGLALSGIDLLAIPDFGTASILLAGLFVYDIFWVFGSKSVFGSNVMVSVAKQFQGPIKLIFPQFPGATASNTSMLGLGDIVVPGLFVALMLRFDVRKVSIDAPFPTRLPYFFGAIIAYFAGLVATYVALTVFKAAQPALLYLVPCCLLTALAMAAVKGEFSELIAYSEDEVEAPEKEKTKQASTDGQTSTSDADSESTVTTDTRQQQEDLAATAETKKDQ